MQALKLTRVVAMLLVGAMVATTTVAGTTVLMTVTSATAEAKSGGGGKGGGGGGAAEGVGTGEKIGIGAAVGVTITTDIITIILGSTISTTAIGAASTMIGMHQDITSRATTTHAMRPIMAPAILPATRDTGPTILAQAPTPATTANSTGVARLARDTAIDLNPDVATAKPPSTDLSAWKPRRAPENTARTRQRIVDGATE